MVNNMLWWKEYEWVLFRVVVANQAFKNTQRAPNTTKKLFVGEVWLRMYLQEKQYTH